MQKTTNQLTNASNTHKEHTAKSAHNKTNPTCCDRPGLCTKKHQIKKKVFMTPTGHKAPNPNQEFHDNDALNAPTIVSITSR